MGIESLRSASALSEVTLRAIARDEPGDVVLSLEELAPDRWFAWSDPLDGNVKQRTLLQIAVHHGATETVAALLRIPGARRGLALASPTDGTTALDEAVGSSLEGAGRILGMLVRPGTPMGRTQDALEAHRPTEVRIRPRGARLRASVSKWGAGAAPAERRGWQRTQQASRSGCRAFAALLTSTPGAL